MEFVSDQFIDDVLHQLSQNSLCQLNLKNLNFEAFNEVLQEHLDRRIYGRLFVTETGNEIYWSGNAFPDLSAEAVFRYLRIDHIYLWTDLMSMDRKRKAFVEEQKYIVEELETADHFKFNIEKNEFLWKVYAKTVEVNYSKNTFIAQWHLTQNPKLQRIETKFHSEEDYDDFLRLWWYKCEMKNLEMIASILGQEPFKKVLEKDDRILIVVCGMR
ncbi:hypothetical protein L596_010188 [Steinernema carpocapsae]|uniref:Uncharacterized protein n=1 Tax=Steinernema carpocapsae TaxID=34508 RepID=A0A4V6A6T5_STECR|nr:hypothetical protein L596_010188 [Steinernema carpocapsae]